ncbi:unnamed protein product [Acanthoscelides obtectus]|uniref:Chitin-binding type-2 domain-containing protein n=1 Tax=Acanthoscelides obtectus TaxID=200917 RepID=A0A9P0KI86_ACAOB|nr:unnamed protein product [Acanthoscelides obtectus]CAK1667743.1 hypothetical protein AOBTE_LOCUS26016 [Acanthoscelides obtectus]
MWWYNIKLETCPNGQVFNVTSKNCAEGTCNSPETPTTAAITPSTTATAAATTNAETADLTTTAATTTTEATASASTTTADTTEAITTSQTTIPPMTTLKPDKPPDCKSVGAGNYPAQKCNQYYKCTKIMWWYNIQLQTCRNGRIFDLSSRRCERGSCSSPTEISSPATTAAKSSAATIRTTATTPPTTL